MLLYEVMHVNIVLMHLHLPNQKHVVLDVAVKNPHPGSGILTGFPFDRRPGQAGTLKRSFPIS